MDRRLSLLLKEGGEEVKWKWVEWDLLGWCVSRFAPDGFPCGSVVWVFVRVWSRAFSLGTLVHGCNWDENRSAALCGIIWALKLEAWSSTFGNVFGRIIEGDHIVRVRWGTLPVLLIALQNSGLHLNALWPVLGRYIASCCMTPPARTSQ